MQTLVQARCSKGPSLRRQIGDDPRLGRFDLEVIWEKKPGRPHGWAKLRSTRDARGAINVEWHGPTRMLSCRVVTKGLGKPHAITGDLIDYLLARFRNRIEVINVFAR